MMDRRKLFQDTFTFAPDFFKRNSVSPYSNKVHDLVYCSSSCRTVFSTVRMNDALCALCNKPKSPCLRLACLMYHASNLICNLMTDGLKCKRNTG
jgi:hypothetical protein